MKRKIITQPSPFKAAAPARKRKTYRELDDKSNTSEESNEDSPLRKIPRTSVERDEENGDITESGVYEAEAYFYIFNTGYFTKKFYYYLKNLDEDQWSIVTKELLKNDEGLKNYLKNNYIVSPSKVDFLTIS